MQNTSRVQSLSNNIIRNFFIGGLKQETLKEKMENDSTMEEQIHIKPEVLFSLYSPESEMESYLKFVFPENISIEQRDLEVIPKFFTFMSTDGEGSNSYFHCLVFYEQFTKHDIKHDFDLHGREFRRQNNLLANKNKPKKTISRVSLREARQIEGEFSPMLDSNDDLLDADEVPENLGNQFKKARGQRGKNQGGYTAAGINPQTSKDDSTIRASQNRQNMMIKQKNSQFGTKTTTSIPSEKMIDFGKFDAVREQSDEENDEQENLLYKKKKSTNSFASKSRDEGFSRQRQIDGNQPEFGANLAAERAITNVMQQAEKGDQQSGNFNDSGERSRESSEDDNRSSNDKYFVPVALVICTEIENHDIFRGILQSLFESIRVPQQVSTDVFENKKLAFADMIAHIAFLKTIPYPSFNSRLQIQFFNKTVIVDEQNYIKIPHRNTIAIESLFDVLDVRSILYMWKAMLFDKTLVLISTQTSLQFYVAEALKQLIFPLTWQHSYIQPAAYNLRDYAESPTPVIFCCSPMEMDFDYFLQLEKEGMSNLAILDIDGSYTNEFKFSTIQNEGITMRALNTLKNKRIQKYDYAFKEMADKDIQENDQNFIQEVRLTFFNLLKPLLSNVKEFIDKTRNRDDADTVFTKYFNKKGYLESFAGEAQEAFSKDMLNSSQFQHFCDDFFLDDEITNFKLFFNIILESDDYDVALNEEEKQEQKIEMQSALLKKQGKSEYEIIEILNSQNPESKAMSCGDFENQKKFGKKQLVIDWRMPQDSQRVMIFEQLSYLIDTQIEKDSKLYDQSRELIKTILNLYPKKLKILESQIALMNDSSKQDDDNQTASFKSSKSQNSSKNLKNSLTSESKKESDKITTNYNKITKLIYGKNGLITFLDHLFLDINADYKSKFNFYFALKLQINQLETSVKKTVPAFQQKDNDDEEEVDYEILNCEAKFTIVKSNRPNQDASGRDQEKEKEIGDSKSAVDDIVCQFENERRWIYPNDWQTYGEQQRLTHQYILLKIKLLITYESFEEGIRLTFKEFMKLPQRKTPKEFLSFFPIRRFEILLMYFTYDQKLDYVQRHTTKLEKNQQLRIMKEQLDLESKGKKGLSLDIGDLKTLSIEKVIQQREQSIVSNNTQQKVTSSQSVVFPSPTAQSKNQNTKEPNQKNYAKEKLLSQKQEERKSETKKGFLSHFQKKQKSPPKTKPKQVEEANKVSINESMTSFDSFRSNTLGNIQRPTSTSLALGTIVNRQTTLNESSISLDDCTVGLQQIGKRTILMSQGYQEARNLLISIIKFWQINIPKLDSQRLTFPKDQMQSLEDQVYKIQQDSIQKLKFTRFDLTITKEVDEKQQEYFKQGFWCNILNFMTLLRIAEICLINPALMRRMKYYAMWQTMWCNNFIYISECKLSQYDIFHTILRSGVELAQYGALMFKKLSVAELDQIIRPLVPNLGYQTVMVFFYTPCPHFFKLHITSSDPKKFHSKSGEILEDSSRDLFQLDQDYFMVKLCHNLNWYSKDLSFMNPDEIKVNEKAGIDKILKIMSPMMTEEMQEEAVKIISKVKATREKAGKVYHVHQFLPAVWTFSYDHFKDSVLSVVVSEQLAPVYPTSKVPVRDEWQEYIQQQVLQASLSEQLTPVFPTSKKVTVGDKGQEYLQQEYLQGLL